ncbi:MAG: iron-sulfur cluster assembly accessory protein [Methylococcaceae bacterium]|nr:iron-sulfur cluster assembly accessory protein [Methylococcaceae bacterium]MCI0733751.1 iron-sulfur cluster assembly accessory protein [Methylococcaceae bacterium]
MSIQLTENAAAQVRRQLDKRGGGLGLRLGVKKSGCSGFAYVIDFADRLEDGDQVYEDFGVKLVVNSEHLPFLDGVRVDYQTQGLNAAFQFDNPNVKDSCGCGESFSV